MMMVDTINPNTEEPDNFANPVPQPEPTMPPIVDPASVPTMGSDFVPASGNDDHFYGGFDRPDDMKINLAVDPGSEGVGSLDPARVDAQPSVASVQPNVAAVPFADLTPAPETMESKVHNSYNKKDDNNPRMAMIIAGVGLLLVFVLGMATYFLVNSSNNSKLAKQEEALASLNSSLDSLKQTPDSLQAVISAEETTTADTPEVPVTTTTEVVPDTQEIKTTDTKVLGSEEDSSGAIVVDGADG